MSNFKNLSLKLKKNARKNHLSDHGSAKLKWHWRKKMGNGEIQKEWNPPENIHIFYSLETMYPNWLIQYDLEPIFKFSTGNNRIEDEKDLFAFFFWLGRRNIAIFGIHRRSKITRPKIGRYLRSKNKISWDIWWKWHLN